MATARMRHHNSPEELAKRSGEPEPSARKGKEFRHYNHPEEVAKRAAAGQPGGVPVVPRRVVPTTGTPAEWPPAGTIDNTASVEVTTSAAPAATPEKPPTEPPPGKRGDVDTRLRRIENLLWSFVTNVSEARDFRRLLNNQDAVTETQQDINNRVRALEETLDSIAAQLNDDGDEEADDDGDDDDEADDDPSAELPPLELDAPPALEPDASVPATVPDNPQPKGET